MLASKFTDEMEYQQLINGEGEEIIRGFLCYEENSPAFIDTIIDYYNHAIVEDWENRFKTKIIKYIEKPLGI